MPAENNLIHTVLSFRFPSGVAQGVASPGVPFEQNLDENKPATEPIQPVSTGADMTDRTHEEVSAKIAAAEARTDTKIVRLEGKLDTVTATIVGKLDAVNDKISADHEYNRTTRWVIVSLVAALALLIVGMATYGDAMFGRGLDVRDLIQTTIKETLAQQAAPKK
jgi:hypothetical protein